MVKCLPEFEYFYCVLEKNNNIIFKIRRSKVTDYAALRVRMVHLKYVLKRVSFGSKDCTKELKLECAYFLGQTS